MAINKQQLLQRRFDEQHETLSANRHILYALGVGLGGRSCDPIELRYTYEQGLHALPTFATTLGHPGFWVAEPESGINWRRVVHGEQRMEIHRALPVCGAVTARNRVEAVFDRGAGKGAIVTVRRELRLEDGGLQSIQWMSMFARDDGGFGGTPPPRIDDPPWPDRPPDAVVERATLPQAALIYRLSGDYNPLHADPAAAKAAGFDRPILHGLCTYAIAGWMLASSCAGGDAGRLSALKARFTSPVYPGETIRTEIWREGGEARFRSIIAERGVVVLDRGHAAFHGMEQS